MLASTRVIVSEEENASPSHVTKEATMNTQAISQPMLSGITSM